MTILEQLENLKAELEKTINGIRMADEAELKKLAALADPKDQLCNYAISTRLRGVCYRLNVDTLSALSRLSEREFRMAKNCGKAMLREARDLLATRQLQFSEIASYSIKRAP